MDPAEDRQFRPKARTRTILTAVIGVLLLAIITGVTIFIPEIKRSGESSSWPQSPVSTSSSIKVVCSVTRYPGSCFESLSSASVNSSGVTSDPVVLFQISLSVASRSISKLSAFLSTLDIPSSGNLLQAAVHDCKELFDDAINRLNDSSVALTEAKPGEKILSDSRINDLKTWLSAAITDQETCLDGFEGAADGFQKKLKAAMVNSTRFTSNSLAIVSGILGIMEKLHFPINRKLLDLV